MQRREFTQRLATAGLGGSLVLTLPGLAAAQGAPREGTHYVRLPTPAPVSPPAGKKFEVVEFFSYSCVHCFAFEPILEQWIKRLPPDVGFRHVPVGFMAAHQLHQRLFYALEETGQLAAMHRKVFNAIHRQGQRLARESDIVAFVKANGGDSAKVEAAMKGFGVATKSNRAKQLTDAYKIDGTPSLGVHGRFYTAASLAGGHERAVAVADFLIQQVRRG
jgi:protein dithiol oxidoreductase (disulfide-forming)